MSSDIKKVVIIGTGVAGLAAGIYIKRSGNFDVTFIEASDKPGGRLKSENIDGFILDYGFHIFFTANNIANELLNIDDLNLKYFDSGALIIKKHNYRKIYDPFKHPKYFLKSLFSEIGTINDKINIIKRRIELKNMSIDKVFDKYEVKTSSILKKRKYSSNIIKNLFKPFFSYLFMENELTTSRRMFEFYLKLLAEGKMAIPNNGIEEIAKQMASNFDINDFRFNCKAKAIENDKLLLENGETIEADAFVVATDFNGLYSKIKNAESINLHRSVTCFYFSANKKPFKEKLICVNANDPKLVNSIAVLSNISHSYAPKGKVLIAVTILGIATIDEELLENEIKDEISNVFGSQVYEWKKIKAYKIDYAIPNQDFVLGKRQITEIKSGNNVYICGDHLLNGTVYGAMKSGKTAAELLQKDLSPSKKDNKKKSIQQLLKNNED